MRIAGIYSFNNGQEVVEAQFPNLLSEIKKAIASIIAEDHKTKESEEITMPGKMLYSPSSLNKAFKLNFERFGGWRSVRVKAEYSVNHYHEGYKPEVMNKNAFREMDFVKGRLGVEVPKEVIPSDETPSS